MKTFVCVFPHRARYVPERNALPVALTPDRWAALYAEARRKVAVRVVAHLIATQLATAPAGAEWRRP